MEIELPKNQPVYLGRTHSLDGRKRTSGLTTPVIIIPNNQYHCFKNYHDSVTALPAEKAQLMLGCHLKWDDRVEDEFISYSKSILFLLVHALRRHELGQRQVFVALGKTTSLTDLKGEKASFYPAVPLSNRLRVQDYDAPRIGAGQSRQHGWDAYEREKLHDRKFTQEYLTFGMVLDPERALMHIALETLCYYGLGDLLPEIFIDGVHERTGNYNCLVAIREVNFWSRPEGPPITKEEIDIATRLARLFQTSRDKKPPFHIISMFLGMRLRAFEDDDIFERWVLANYTCERACIIFVTQL
jgi:hypothetical protein